MGAGAFAGATREGGVGCRCTEAPRDELLLSCVTHLLSYVTYCRAVSFYSPSTSTGLCIPYPHLTLHAISRAPTTADGATGQPCIYCQVDENEALEESDEMPEGETREVIIVPADPAARKSSLAHPSALSLFCCEIPKLEKLTHHRALLQWTRSLKPSRRARRFTLPLHPLPTVAGYSEDLTPIQWCTPTPMGTSSVLERTTTLRRTRTTRRRRRAQREGGCVAILWATRGRDRID